MTDLSPDDIIELLDEATVSNRMDSLREGHILTFPDYGQVIMTGDIHGHMLNLKKLEWFANLERSIQRHVVIHELIHFTNQPDVDGDNSLLVLMEAVKWKVDYPDQVHFLMGNHDLAQLTNREISKGGAPSIANFNSWIMKRYGESAAEKILAKLDQFILSMPLAARCPNKIWLSHSLPGGHAIDGFDFSIFNREWDDEDTCPKGSVYELLWGRNHTTEQLDKIASMLNLDYFILGHQRQEEGYAVQGRRMVILASDHGLGCFLPIDLSRKYKFPELVERIKFFHDLPELEASD